jgi:hypothetical protein
MEAAKFFQNTGNNLPKTLYDNQETTLQLFP